MLIAAMIYARSIRAKYTADTEPTTMTTPNPTGPTIYLGFLARLKIKTTSAGTLCFFDF